MNAESQTATAAPSGLTTAIYTVSGMTCGHCVHAVTTELGDIDGVHEVQVDLASGDVRVASTHQLDFVQVRAAIDEAGYQLA